MKITNKKKISNLKIYILAGEASGDYLGSKLIQSLRSLPRGTNDITFKGSGGELMKQEGIHSKFSANSVSSVGFIEVLGKIFKAIKLINVISDDIIKFKPNIVISIDAPSFCFRVIKKIATLRSQGTKFVHYVSPSVWVYKNWRVDFMSKYYDLVLAIFPFEPKYYRRVRLQCKYVGHPVLEHNWAIISSFKEDALIAKNTRIIGVMCGSRISEIKILLPIFIDALNIFTANNKNRNFVAVFPAVSEEAKNLILSYKNKMNFYYKVIKPKSSEEKINIIKSFSCAIVKSGTSSHELMCAETPMIVAYRVNIITYWIAKYIFSIHKKIKYASLANLLLNKELIPEYIQNKCNAVDLSKGIERLHESNFCETQRKGYRKAKNILATGVSEFPSVNAATLVLDLMK